MDEYRELTKVIIIFMIPSHDSYELECGFFASFFAIWQRSSEALVNLKSEKVVKYGLGSAAGMKAREECYQK